MPGEKRFRPGAEFNRDAHGDAAHRCGDERPPETNVHEGRRFDMKLVDILLWVVGAAATIFGLYELMRFASAKDPVTGHQNLSAGMTDLYWAIGALIVAAVCIVAAFVRRPHVEEEIHITK